MPRSLVPLAVPALLLAIDGCKAPNKEVYARTSLDQLLVSAAIGRAADKIEFGGATFPKKLAVRMTGPERADLDLIRRVVVHRLATLGIVDADEDEAGGHVLEVRVEASGTATEHSLIGIPLTFGPFPIADVSVYKSSKQYALTRMGLTLWGPGGQILTQVPPLEGRSHYNNFTFLTIFGPFVAKDLPTVP